MTTYANINSKRFFFQWQEQQYRQWQSLAKGYRSTDVGHKMEMGTWGGVERPV